MKTGKLRKNIFYTDDGINVNIFGLCVFSDEHYSVVVPSEGFNKWLNGELIQKAMPEVPAEKREFLISGISPSGWNSTFGDE